MSNIFNLCILQNFVKTTFGDNFPTELVHFIMILQYDPIIISKSGLSTFITKDKTYACGKNYGNNLSVLNYISKFKNIPTRDIKCIYDRDVCAAILTKNNDICINWAPISLTCSLLFNIPNYTINEVACGYLFTIALSSCGKVFSHGRNHEHELGLGDTLNRDNFTQIISIESAISVSCGLYHSVALMENGTLFSWGRNEYGQLGYVFDVAFPRKIDLENIVSVKCGNYFTIALDKNGIVYSWGNNEMKQLRVYEKCRDHKKYYKTPQKVFVNVSQISCGYDHVAILSTTGDVYVWGSNNKRQFGNCNKRTQKMIFLDKIKSNGIKSIVCGGYHTCVVMRTDQIYCWGNNDHGQLGLGNCLPCKDATELKFIH